MGLERDNRAMPYIVGRMIAITQHYAGKQFGGNTVTDMMSHPKYYIGTFAKYIDKNDEYYNELKDITLPGVMRNPTEMGQVWVGYYHQRAEYEKLTDRKSLGAQIKRLRALRGMSQRQLAEAAGITPANVANIELGKYSVGYDVLARIATAMNAMVWLIENEQTNSAG